MSCSQFQNLIHGYLDGELDLAGSLEVEKHLPLCEGCMHTYQNQQAMRAAIREGSLYHPSPPQLRSRILSAIVAESGSPMRIDRSSNVRWWIGIAATIVIAAGLAWQLIPRANESAGLNAITQELVSDHIRSLLATHLMDVQSTDQHTVKPWFNGKTDFSPTVQNFAKDGFVLVGGRLDYADGRSIAALVYQHNKHFINVFVWPIAEKQKLASQSLSTRGYHVIQWSDGGFNYTAISDMAMDDLQRLAQLMQKPAPTTENDLNR
jgi:anti-sigma factor RsiW